MTFSLFRSLFLSRSVEAATVVITSWSYRIGRNVSVVWYLTDEDSLAGVQLFDSLGSISSASSSIGGFFGNSVLLLFSLHLPNIKKQFPFATHLWSYYGNKYFNNLCIYIFLFSFLFLFFSYLCFFKYIFILTYLSIYFYMRFSFIFFRCKVIFVFNYVWFIFLYFWFWQPKREILNKN